MNKWMFPFLVPQSASLQNKTGPAVATALWLILLTAVGILIARNPYDSTVTDYYNNASAHWFAGQPLYGGGHMAMNYLPHYAIIFSIFHFLPRVTGEILWRVFNVAVLASGVWRWTKLLMGEPAARVYAWITPAIIPLCAAAVRNGQANTLLGGLMLHAAFSLATRKWWSAALLIWLAAIAKPVAVVLALLTPFVYKPLRLPLLATLVIVAAFPFFFGKPAYVIAEYRAFAANMSDCATVSEYDYADLTGILDPLHIRLQPRVSLCIRALAGFAALVFWLLGARRLDAPLRAFFLYSLAAAYLMVFNPMNESNSYVIFAPAPAIWAAWFLDRSPRGWRGWLFAFMVLSMGLLPNIVRRWFGNKFALCYHPSMTILFLAVLVSWVLAQRKPAENENGNFYSTAIERTGE